MKTNFKSMLILLIPAMILHMSCGGGQAVNKTENNQLSKKVRNAVLDQHIEELAACEMQNVNCEAYNKTSAFVQEQCKDKARRDSIIEDLFVMIEQGASPKKQAAANALNFWTGYGENNFRDNASYGKIVLEALLKEKFSSNSYVGSSLGQLLSGWLNTSDTELFSSLVDAMKSKNTEKRGRNELIRLCSEDAMDKPEVFDVMVGIVNDVDDDKDTRIQTLNVMWRVKSEDRKTTVRSIYESMTSNPDIHIAGAAMRGLGYLQSFASYDLIEKTLTDNKNNVDWYNYGSTTLNELLRNVPDSLDKKRVFNLVKMLITNKEVDEYQRSFYVYTLSLIDTPASKSLIGQLKKGNEKKIVDEINRVVK